MRPRLHPRAAAASLLLPVLLASCGGPAGPASAPAFEPKNQAKCSVSASQARPLIVEWPSADRLDLEAQAKKGIVAVHYVGCEMEVLRQCKAPGAYAYTATTRQDDEVRIRDEDELYAQIPVHAAKFEGKLKKAGELDVTMTMVGRYEADRPVVRADELSGDCARATHFVSSVIAGSFEFFAGAEAESGAGAFVAGAGAGVKTGAQREMLNRAGDKSACAKSTSKDTEPPDGCGALLRVEVIPLGQPSSPAAALATATPVADVAARVAAPSAQQGACPSGMIEVQGGSMTAALTRRPESVRLLGDAAAPRATRVPSFCLDASEVSVDAYSACVKQGACTEDDLRCGARATYARGPRTRPINCVGLQQAYAFCESKGRRLPSSEEWEWAARGGERALEHPWESSEPFSAHACLGEPCDVSSTRGDSPDGVHNLVGNVWEWTSSGISGSSQVVRGGGFTDTQPDLFAVRTSLRRVAAESRAEDVGFRCALSLGPARAPAAPKQSAPPKARAGVRN